MATYTATLTPDDLAKLEVPDGVKHYELSDGELIPVGNAFALHELIKRAIFILLFKHEVQTASGKVFSESMFTLRSDRARIPDVAWISNERFAQIPRDNRAIPIAPNIAIEIISDSERQTRAQKKLREYLEADVEVWQIFPDTATVVVWRGSEGKILVDDQLIISPTLPGFSISVAELLII